MEGIGNNGMNELKEINDVKCPTILTKANYAASYVPHSNNYTDLTKTGKRHKHESIR